MLPLAIRRSLRELLQKINSPIGQRVTRNRRRGEAEVLKIPGSFLGIPKVTESVSASEEEGGSSHDPDDASSQNNDSDEGESDDEESSCTDDYTDAEPTYDEADDIYRCARPGCGWEVAFGYCHGCQTKYITEVRLSSLSGRVPTFIPCCRMTIARRSTLETRSQFSGNDC